MQSRRRRRQESPALSCALQAPGSRSKGTPRARLKMAGKEKDCTGAGNVSKDGEAGAGSPTFPLREARRVAGLGDRGGCGCGSAGRPSASWPGAGSAAPFVHLESREAGGAGWSPGLAALWLGETLSQAEPLVSREMNILLERRPPSQALKEKQGALGLVRGPRGARRQRMWLFCCAWCASLATH